MERNIPHVLDIFTHSPGQRRRNRSSEQFLSHQLKEQEKNPGSDSAVSLGSSDDEDENDQKISKYFNYLNEDEKEQRTKTIPTKPEPKTNKPTDPKPNKTDPKTGKADLKTNKPDDDRSRKGEYEMKHIERHLSMKKTIRKKMMRDLQQAFVENPTEFTKDLDIDTERITNRKNHIDLNNLTISKKRMSKSEHSFLDMLKDDKKSIRHPAKRSSKEPDDDSGNDSPTRKVECDVGYRSKSKSDLLEVKDEKKPSFWKRLTGKGKTNAKR